MRTVSDFHREIAKHLKARAFSVNDRPLREVLAGQHRSINEAFTWASTLPIFSHEDVMFDVYIGSRKVEGEVRNFLIALLTSREIEHL